MTDQEKHILHYAVLALGLSIFAVMFLLFNYDSTVQTYFLAGGSFYYVIWGIIHHALENRLNRLIVFEYSLFGILIFLLIFSALSI